MDAEVLARARAGDEAALAEVLATLAPSVHRFGLGMCRNEADAEDVVQDTLLAVAQRLSEFRGEASLSTWVFTLARTACARRRRGLAQRPHQTLEAAFDAASGEPSPEDRVTTREIAEIVSRALDELSDEAREVIVLRDIEGLSAKEAAEIVGVSVDALKSRLHRARRGLNDALRAMMAPERASLAACPDVATMLSRKLEDELSPELCQEMEAHLAGCPTCDASCQRLKLALGTCRAFASRPLPDGVARRVKRALEEWATGATR